MTNWRVDVGSLMVEAETYQEAYDEACKLILNGDVEIDTIEAVEEAEEASAKAEPTPEQLERRARSIEKLRTLINSQQKGATP